MRVWQPGSSLVQHRELQVQDWSWAQTKRRLTTLYRLARPYRLRTALAIVFLLGATAMSLVPPLLIGLAVNEVGDGTRPALPLDRRRVRRRRRSSGSPARTARPTSPAGRASGCSPTCATTSSGTCSGCRSASTSATAPGALISRITNDVEALDQLVTDGVTSLVQNSLTLIGTAVILFVLDWRLALATFTVVPLLASATAIFRRKSARSYRRVRERLGLVTATLAEDIAGMRVLQAFTRERAARENFRTVNERYRA